MMHDTTETKDPRIVVALDFPDRKSALSLVDQLSPEHCRLKVGKQLFTAAGPELVRELVQRGYDIFLDLKFHDIPNTVAFACRAAADLGVWMLNVHALGGKSMLEAAADAVKDSTQPRPLLIAVTLLTSLDQIDIETIGLRGSVQENVTRLAKLTADSGLDGVVCSAQEATILKQTMGEEFVLVTPGIRLQDTRSDDQVRVVTPTDAISHGSDYLVVGRPITSAPDPMNVLQKINEEIRRVK